MHTLNIIIFKMSNNNAIQIILRVRPSQNPYNKFNIDKQTNIAQFIRDKDVDQGYVNNQKEKIKFKFDQIFDMDARQQKVFDKIAKDVVDSAIEGYNGTIFAYGQTGSGKTFTMTGGDVEEGAGIIPRTLKYIFYTADVKGLDIKVNIRYMQIYNGQGYDLFDPESQSDKVQIRRNLEDLRKVQTLEGPNGELHLKNLETHTAKNVSDAMQLLFVGDTNRVTCRTPKNDQSTRSHCIFMISLETTRPGTDVKTVATINLVDLSGSQRIKQTQVQGLLQKEAISINLGLHYLERVIVALNAKMNGENIHVPYRQSLMTSVLRDSIGGNCKTRMVATMSSKQQDILESIATCKFAQRVALIKNSVCKNETVDPGIIIARLKKENAQLKAEIALLKGQNVKDQLDKYEIQDCRKAVDGYIVSQDPQASLIMDDRLKINQCFYYLKTIVRKGGKPLVQNNSKISENNSNNVLKENSSGGEMNHEEKNRHTQQIDKLRLLLQCRDNQIALLLTMISKKKNINSDGQPINIPVKRMNQQQKQMMQSIVQTKPIQFKKQEQLLSQLNKSSVSRTTEQTRMQKNWVEQGAGRKNKGESNIMKGKQQKDLDAEQIQRMLTKPLNLSSQQLMDEAMAFDKFRNSSRRYEALKQNAKTLEQKIIEGKEVGKIANESRDKISKLKAKLQQIKRQNAVNNLVGGIQLQDPKQAEIREQIGQKKQIYKHNYEKLKAIRTDIQSINALQKKNKQQLDKDFLRYIQFAWQRRQKTISNVDSSILTSNIRDKEVQKHLQSFMKARDQIRKKV